MEKLCVDIIGSYIMLINVNEENLGRKYVTMKDPVTGWPKIT